MTQAPSPDRDPEFVRALLAETQDAHAHLLFLIEQSLGIDPVEHPEQVEIFNRQIQSWMSEADTRLNALLERIRPWEETRGAFPPDLAAAIDKFLGLLRVGIDGLSKQLTHRGADLAARKEQTRKALESLNQQRQGLKNYKQAPAPQGVRKKA
jgi:hypothetical protein